MAYVAALEEVQLWCTVISDIGTDVIILPQAIQQEL